MSGLEIMTATHILTKFGDVLTWQMINNERLVAIEHSETTASHQNG